MKSQLFIPKKLKVGYQKREDTYTKKLAYVIYYDNKNVLRKEKSWRGWVTANLGTPDVDNIPTEGFVLNKEVGGVSRYSHSWDQRMEKVRVFDPRGHEFEIGIPNLLYILQECSSFKGKGLEGEFIYAWDGPELVLLPVSSKEYKECAEFTNIQSNKVKKDEMVLGAIYQTKKQEKIVYLGQYPIYSDLNYHYGNSINVSKAYVFVDETRTRGDQPRYTHVEKLDNISNIVDDQCHPKFAEMVDKLLKKPFIGKVLSVNASNQPVALIKKDSYRGYDYTQLSGNMGYYYHEYSNTDKIPGTYFIPVDGQKDTWHVCTFVRHLEIKKDEKNYNQTFKLKGFEMKCARIVRFENNELVIKAATKPTKNLLSLPEIKTLDTHHLAVKLSDNKIYSLFN